MIGKRIVLMIVGVATLISVSGFVLISVASKSTIEADVHIDSSDVAVSELVDTSGVENSVENQVIAVSEVMPEDKSSHPVGEKVVGRSKEIVITEPCDFEEMKLYSDNLLDRSDVSALFNTYENIEYEEVIEGATDMLLDGRWLYSCYLKVKLSNYFATDEAWSEDRETAQNIADWLKLINPSLSYEGSSVSSELFGKYDAVVYSAGGPSGSFFGTFVHEDDQDSVRFIGVNEGVYIENRYPENGSSTWTMCPCEESVTIQITNQFSEADIRNSLSDTD